MQPYLERRESVTQPAILVVGWRNFHPSSAPSLLLAEAPSRLAAIFVVVDLRPPHKGVFLCHLPESFPNADPVLSAQFSTALSSVRTGTAGSAVLEMAPTASRVAAGSGADTCLYRGPAASAILIVTALPRWQLGYHTPDLLIMAAKRAGNQGPWWV